MAVRLAAMTGVFNSEMQVRNLVRRYVNQYLGEDRFETGVFAGTEAAMIRFGERNYIQLAPVPESVSSERAPGDYRPEFVIQKEYRMAQEAVNDPRLGGRGFYSELNGWRTLAPFKQGRVRDVSGDRLTGRVSYRTDYRVFIYPSDRLADFMTKEEILDAYRETLWLYLAEKYTLLRQNKVHSAITRLMHSDHHGDVRGFLPIDVHRALFLNEYEFDPEHKFEDGFGQSSLRPVRDLANSMGHANIRLGLGMFDMEHVITLTPKEIESIARQDRAHYLSWATDMEVAFLFAYGATVNGIKPKDLVDDVFGVLRMQQAGGANTPLFSDRNALMTLAFAVQQNPRQINSSDYFPLQQYFEEQMPFAPEDIPLRIFYDDAHSFDIDTRLPKEIYIPTTAEVVAVRLGILEAERLKRETRTSLILPGDPDYAADMPVELKAVERNAPHVLDETALRRQVIAQYNHDRTDTASSPVRESYTGEYMYHVALKAEWEAQKDSTLYAPSSYGQDQFIHFTSDLRTLKKRVGMLPVSQLYVVLKVRADRKGIAGNTYIEEGETAYPHLFSALPVDAVEEVFALDQAENGPWRLPQDVLKVDMRAADDTEAALVQALGVLEEKLDRRIYEVNGKEVPVTRYMNQEGETVPFLRVGPLLITRNKFVDNINDDDVRNGIKDYPFLILLDYHEWTPKYYITEYIPREHDDRDSAVGLNYQSPEIWPDALVGLLVLMVSHANDFRGASVIDLGAGQSGFLSIAAYILGAEEIIAVEQGREAARILQENLSLNQLDSGKYRVVSKHTDRLTEKDVMTARPPIVLLNLEDWGTATLVGIGRYLQEQEMPLESLLKVTKKPGLLLIGGGTSLSDPEFKIALDVVNASGGYFSKAVKIIRSEWSTEVASIGFSTLPQAPDRKSIAASPVNANNPIGGISFNPELFDLQIRRDQNGVPLSLPDQPLGDIHIEGILPVILNVVPLNIPLLLGRSGEREGNPPRSLPAARPETASFPPGREYPGRPREISRLN